MNCLVRNNFIQNNIKVNAFSKVSEKVHICFTLGRDTTYSPAAAPAPAPVAAQTDDTELIAVIAAAIAASTGTSTSDFVVRSINRR